MVTFPNGLPAPSAEVSFKQANFQFGHGRSHQLGTSGPDGSLSVELSRKRGLTTHFFYDFTATVTDVQMVRWSGTERVHLLVPAFNRPVNERVKITLHRSVQDFPSLLVKSSVWRNLLGSTTGEFLLPDLQELVDTLGGGYPSATLCLAGKVLDGVLKTKGVGTWWDNGWDRDTLGVLLGRDPIKKAIRSDMGDGFLTRLEAVTLPLRNLGAHQKFTHATMSESHAVASVVVELLNKWFG